MPIRSTISWSWRAGSRIHRGPPSSRRFSARYAATESVAGYCDQYTHHLIDLRNHDAERVARLVGDGDLNLEVFGAYSLYLHGGRYDIPSLEDMQHLDEGSRVSLYQRS